MPSHKSISSLVRVFRHVKMNESAREATKLGALSDPLRSSCLGLAMLSARINGISPSARYCLLNIHFSFRTSSQQRRPFSIGTLVSRPPDQACRFPHPALAWLPSEKELNPSNQFQGVRRRPFSPSYKNFSSQYQFSDIQFSAFSRAFHL